MIIHPKGQTSQAYFIKGNGDEVRYGGNAKFRVLDKRLDINEGSNFRDVVGIIELQEI